MQSIQERFPAIYSRVAKDHEGMHGGHDIYHALRVATWARRIAIDEWRNETVPWQAELAALYHNADRILEHNYGRGKAQENATRAVVLEWMSDLHVPQNDKDIILQAVLGHSGK